MIVSTSGCVKLAGGINSLSVATHAYTHAAAHKTEWVTGQRSLLYQSAGRQGLMALLKHEREGTEAQQTSAQTRTATTFAHGKHTHARGGDILFRPPPVLQRSFFMLLRKWWNKWYCCQILITQNQIQRYYMILDCRLFIWDHEATARCASDSTTAGQQTAAVTSSLS